LVKLESALQKLNPTTTNDDRTAYLFLSGMERPNLGDLYVYGTLRAIHGLPIYEEIITQRGGPIVEWSHRMSKELIASSKS
jgi:hypothetical protein